RHTIARRHCHPISKIGFWTLATIRSRGRVPSLGPKVGCLTMRRRRRLPLCPRREGHECLRRSASESSRGNRLSRRLQFSYLRASRYHFMRRCRRLVLVRADGIRGTPPRWSLADGFFRIASLRNQQSRPSSPCSFFERHRCPFAQWIAFCQRCVVG